MNKPHAPHPAGEFIRRLVGDADAVVLFAVLPDHASCAIEATARRGKLADLLPRLGRFNAEGAGIFLTINETRGRRRRIEDVCAVRALFIDSDSLVLPTTWALAPSVVCMRAAATKWHAYWTLAAGEDPKRWSSAQRALAAVYGSDPSVCDLPRVMRVPGFAHVKDPAAPDTYRITATAEGAHTIDQVLEAHGIDPASVTAEEPAVAEPTPLDDHAMTEDERERLMAALDRLTERLAGDPTRSRDRLVGGWIVDAVGAGMAEPEIEANARAWFIENGREAQSREIANWIRSAKEKLASGRMSIRTPGVRVDADFATAPGAPAPGPRLSAQAADAQVRDLTDWVAEIPKTNGGRWISHPRTVQLILAHDSRLVECFAYNAFTSAIEVSRSPWRSWEGTREWTDQDATGFACWAAKAYDARPTIAVDHIHAAVGIHARQRAYHPVRDYLQRLLWDGTPRLDGWLSTYLGVERSPYVEAVGAKTLIAAVARIMRPGCKVDTVLVLEGPQGSYKSTSLRILARPWFSEEEIVVGSKDAVMVLRRTWIQELGELDTLRRAEVTQLKAFLSRQVDVQRDPYARCPTEYPRHSIFIGTTNQAEYLKDATGGRRFWPVRCGAIDLAALEHDRDQIWAEAYTRAQRGEPWWLNRDQEELAQAEQDDRLLTDPWEEPIAAWLADPTGFGGSPPKHITAGEVFAGINPGTVPGRMTDADARRIGGVLRRLGWERRKMRLDGSSRTSWAYACPPTCPPACPPRGTA